MSNKKYPFLNFHVDHMTMLVSPKMYNLTYIIFQTIFGCSHDDIIYEKRKEWIKGMGESSMTFAVCIGKSAKVDTAIQNTIIALVQPSEPIKQPSHVREMLDGHNASAHWQHVALGTSDLLAFHQYALERGVNFITPILKDDDEDLIQVFSGEWYLPDGKPSGLFFEFVQRNPTEALLKKLEEHNRESWFRDKTFLGLYGEKEKEYQSGKIVPFLDHELMLQIQSNLDSKKIWEIKQEDIDLTEKMMLDYASVKSSLSTVR